MELTLFRDGSLTGRYATAVGAVPPNKWYLLSGRYDAVSLQSEIKKGTIGFVVSWQNAAGDSTTSWNGIYDNTGAIPEIRTTWLLTHLTAQPNEWDSTYIKHDRFVQRNRGQCSSSTKQ